MFLSGITKVPGGISAYGLTSRQLEQLESRYKSETDKLLLQVSRLQDVNRKLAVDKANLSADVEKREADLELSRQENRYEIFIFSLCLPSSHKPMMTDVTEVIDFFFFFYLRGNKFGL